VKINGLPVQENAIFQKNSEKSLYEEISRGHSLREDEIDLRFKK